jgi:preprotein translocase subunit YajC
MMGTHILAAGSTAAKSGGGSSELLLLGVIFVIMILFMFRSSRRRQQQAQNTQRQVIDGARVRTSFGVYGTIVESDDRNVMVEIAPGVRIKMLRQAIATVVPDDEPEGVQQTMPDTFDTEPAAMDDLNGTGDRSDKVS